MIYLALAIIVTAGIARDCYLRYLAARSMTVASLPEAVQKELEEIRGRVNKLTLMKGIAR